MYKRQHLPHHRIKLHELFHYSFFAATHQHCIAKHRCDNAYASECTTSAVSYTHLEPIWIDGCSCRNGVIHSKLWLWKSISILYWRWMMTGQIIWWQWMPDVYKRQTLNLINPNNDKDIKAAALSYDIETIGSVSYTHLWYSVWSISYKFLGVNPMLFAFLTCVLKQHHVH